MRADDLLYLRLFTRTADKYFASLPPIVCLFLPSDFLLLDVAPFLSLVHHACIMERLTFGHYLLAAAAYN